MERKAGRPRAISDELIPKILELYDLGLGYRRISRELSKEYQIFADWSTVRRCIKSQKEMKLVSK